MAVLVPSLAAAAGAVQDLRAARRRRSASARSRFAIAIAIGRGVRTSASSASRGPVRRPGDDLHLPSNGPGGLALAGRRGGRGRLRRLPAVAPVAPKPRKLMGHARDARARPSSFRFATKRRPSRELHRELTDTLSAWGRPYELILVDDGSTRRSFEMLARLQAADPHLRVIRFRRNFGQTAAFAAGFDHARGRLIVTSDGDLQNDPRDIPAMVETLEQRLRHRLRLAEGPEGRRSSRGACRR